MTRHLLTIAAVLLALGPSAQARRSVPYSIKISTTYFGRPAEAWLVTRGRIRVETFLRDKGVRVNRKLSADERRRLDTFMASFPLRKLKTRYVSRARGESSTTYEIRIGKQRKVIYQYFRDQKDLTALWQVLRAIADAGKPAPGRAR